MNKDAHIDSQKRRADGRLPGELRPVKITPGVLRHAEGSVEYSIGRTRVLAACSIGESQARDVNIFSVVSTFPRAGETHHARGSCAGRELAIAKLLTRSIVSVTNTKAMGNRVAMIDCEILEADGGTSAACVTAGFFAWRIAQRKVWGDRSPGDPSCLRSLAAIGCGVLRFDGVVMDMDAAEDQESLIDATAAICGDGRLIDFVIHGSATHPSYGWQGKVTTDLQNAAVDAIGNLLQKIVVQLEGAL